MGEHGAHPGMHTTSREELTLSGEGIVALWLVSVPHCTPLALLRRVCRKHLEGSLRTAAEGLRENSFSASWKRSSCYLNHQWARQLSVMTVGFRGHWAPGPASLWIGGTSPCLHAGSLNPLRRLTPLGFHCSV